VSADKDGNLYTGPNTEDTPTVVEATSYKNGLVVAQVTEIVDKVPRVDIPGDLVHFVVEAGRPFYVEPLFTRDPAAITETRVLTGRCDPTAPSARRRASMPATCSSGRRSRSTSRATARR